MMSKLISKIFLLIIILIIIYLVFIFSSDLTKIQNNIAKIGVSELILIIGLWSIGNLVRTIRWHLFLKEIDDKVPFKTNVIYYLSGFALVFLPGRIGELIRSPFLKRNYDISISKSASIVFVERFYDLLGIIIVLTIGLVFVEFDKTILLVPIMFVIIIIILFKNKTLLLKILEKLSKIKWFKNISSSYEESYNSVLKISKTKFFALGIGTATSTYFFQTLAVYLIITSLVDVIRFEQILVIYPTSLFISAISYIPGGIGVFEGGMVGLLSIYDVSYEVAITTTILIRIIGFALFSAIGIICLRIISKD